MHLIRLLISGIRVLRESIVPVRVVPMAEFLIRSGAETDCETDYGESPLSVASPMGRLGRCEIAPRCWR